MITEAARKINSKPQLKYTSFLLFAIDSKEVRVTLQPSYKDIWLSDSRDPQSEVVECLLCVKLNIR
jgi:hypothetical protein